MNASRQEWVDTVQQLVLGSDRAGVESRVLMDKLAAMGVARRGAQLAPLSDATPIDTGPAPGPVVSPELARLLDEVLATEDAGLLYEWCSVVRSTGLVAAPRHLPDLLSVGNARPAFRDVLGAVVGERGVWLARVRPVWSWAAVQAELALIPDRDRLAEQFAEERRSSDRKALLTALEPVTKDDESFLEDALDDRAVEVRGEAFRLLRQLSGTALERRTRIRLREGLTVTDGALEVLPGGPYAGRETPDDEARDLGGQRTAVGSIATRLRGAASCLAPEAWAKLLDRSDDEVVQLVGASRWSVPLASGMLLGLPKSADPARWATALVGVLLDSDVLAVLRSLRTEAGAYVLSALAANPDRGALESAAELVTGPWPEDTTLAVLRRLYESPDARWRANRPPDVLIRRGSVDLLTQYWPHLAERWPEHGRDEYVLTLRRTLYATAQNGPHE